MAVVAMIYVDLVASTAQLLPCMQSEALRGTGSGDGGGGESAGIWVARIVARFMQVTSRALRDRKAMPVSHSQRCE